MTSTPNTHSGSVAAKVGYALPDMAFTLTSDGRYSGFLPGGDIDPLVPPEQFLGRQIEEVVGKDLGHDARSLIQRVIETQSVETFEYELGSNKGVRQFEARVAPLDAEEVVAIVRDVTEQRAPRERKVRALRALADARKAIELAAPYLPRDSGADLAAARALAGIYQLGDVVPTDG